MAPHKTAPPPLGNSAAINRCQKPDAQIHREKVTPSMLASFTNTESESQSVRKGIPYRFNAVKSRSNPVMPFLKSDSRLLIAIYEAASYSRPACQTHSLSPIPKFFRLMPGWSGHSIQR